MNHIAEKTPATVNDIFKPSASNVCVCVCVLTLLSIIRLFKHHSPPPKKKKY